MIGAPVMCMEVWLSVLGALLSVGVTCLIDELSTPLGIGAAAAHLSVSTTDLSAFLTSLCVSPSAPLA